MASVIADMEACIPALRRYAATLLRDRQEVDDLVHDCLVRALDRLHTRRDDGELRAWLFTIMHNLFISRMRRVKLRGTAEPLDTADEAVLGQRPGQDDHMRHRDLMRGLDELPEDQRSVLLLVAVEDLSYAEAARVMGVPVGTVMSRLSRAREKLRRSMGEEAPTALRRVK
jgi:RNA polymerase sigma-70 factor (ECF subfamily)